MHISKNNPGSKPGVLVAQKGAREHFLVARALHQRGLLAQLVVDWNAPKSRPFPSFSVSAFQRFAQSALAARTEGIPDGLVRAFPFRSLMWKWRVRRLAGQGLLHEGYAKTDAAFALAVARLDLPSHNVFFGYSYASLEMLEAERRRGVLIVLDQIDPGPAEFRLVAKEMARFREVAGPPPVFPVAYYSRLRSEWRLSDVILVNSDWTKQAIVAEGADPAKIEILPLAYEAPKGTRINKQHGISTFQRFSVSASAPLKVLWLGQVNVRKGIHCLIESARLLEREPVHFEVVGPIGILPAAVASAPRNMTFHGPVSRDRTSGWYAQTDVFVLPTLSDGFAITQLEALAHGLPVVTTPNCGRVVEDGKTGFILAARDAKALADSLLKFVRDPELPHRMRPACIQAGNSVSVDTYGEKLVEIIEKRLKLRTLTS